MNIPLILQPSNVFFIPKTNNLNEVRGAIQLEGKVSQTNMENLNISRDNPNLEKNYDKKMSELKSYFHSRLEDNVRFNKEILQNSFDTARRTETYNSSNTNNSYSNSSYVNNQYKKETNN